MIRISYRTKSRYLSYEALETRQCLSTVSFTSHDVVVSEANGALRVIAADLDQDGDLDVISGSAWDRKMAWYENVDGKGVFGQQRLIAAEAASISKNFCVPRMSMATAIWISLAFRILERPGTLTRTAKVHLVSRGKSSRITAQGTFGPWMR